jgi:hypothetical protein
VTRYYLGISSSGPNVLRNVRLDETGEPLLLIDQDAIAKITIDFTDWLETGETLSGLTATPRGCEVSVSTSGPKSVLTISEVTSFDDGDITIIGTSSTGEKYRGIIRVRRTARYRDESTLHGDYV